MNGLRTPSATRPCMRAKAGSAAAPTAGLHFTPELIEKLKGQGIGFAYLTLHVGLDTFAPVTEEDPAEHVIHTEWCELGVEAAEQINRNAPRGRPRDRGRHDLGEDARERGGRCETG